MKHLPVTLTKTVAALALCGAVGSAQAYSFECITGAVTPATDALGCTNVGESLLQWTVVGNMLLIGNNDLPGNASSITGISFLTASGQSVALSPFALPGIVFTTGGGAKLPASLGWGTTVDFKANKKPMTNGVNAGEMIVFDLSGVTPASIASGAFKFGVHLQGLPDGRSEKLISAVPEAETYALGLAGLLTVAVLARRRQRQA